MCHLSLSRKFDAIESAIITRSNSNLSFRGIRELEAENIEFEFKFIRVDLRRLAEAAARMSSFSY